MDAPTLYRLLGENLAVKLIKQDRRTHDREWVELWQEFDNFGEFYEAWKHAFVMPFSTPERLAASILKIYLHRQLSAVVQREEGKRSSNKEFLRLDRALSGAVEAVWPEVLVTLKERWPREWADIKRRNAGHLGC